MHLPLFFADAFTDAPFKGNPAAVVMAHDGLPDSLMQQIATEIGFSETAFLKKVSHQVYDIRYFTPKQEIPLCGHATLASAAVLFGEEGLHAVHFITGNKQQLEVQQKSEGIFMRFPKYPVEPFNAPAPMLAALGMRDVKASAYNPNLRIILLELEDASLLRQLSPDFTALRKSYEGINGVLVTSVSNEEPYDFMYRYFWPWSGTDEDPVTGGVQTFLAPYWASKLGNKHMRALQPSERTGKMEVEVDDHEVRIMGQVVVTMKGQLNF